MKLKNIITLVLCSALLLSTGAQVNAKDYYKKDFGFPGENFKPDYATEEQTYSYSMSLMDCGMNKTKKTTSKKDFNQDGKLEKIELCVKPVKGKAKATIKLNNKLVVSKLESSGDYTLLTYQLRGRTIVVLRWGWDQSSEAVVYEWRGNKFKELLSLKKNHLDFYISSGKSDKKEAFYIEFSDQLYNKYGKKWPKNVLKRYKKYANRKSCSATRTTYEKYIFKGNGLKKAATDKYYYVSQAYE